jgi:hypothetical protein
MANINGTAEVAQTPSKEQNANGQEEAAEEDGVDGQLPDSMCNWESISGRNELIGA